MDKGNQRSYRALALNGVSTCNHW